MAPTCTSVVGKITSWCITIVVQYVKFRSSKGNQVMKILKQWSYIYATAFCSTNTIKKFNFFLLCCSLAMRAALISLESPQPSITAESRMYERYCKMLACKLSVQLSAVEKSCTNTNSPSASPWPSSELFAYVCVCRVLLWLLFKGGV